MNIYTFLPKLLNMSFTGTIAIICVLLLRLLLKKTPKVISYALWLIVLFRLLCPFSVESGFSFLGLMGVSSSPFTLPTGSIEEDAARAVSTENVGVDVSVSVEGEDLKEIMTGNKEQLRVDSLKSAEVTEVSIENLPQGIIDLAVGLNGSLYAESKAFIIGTYLWFIGVLAMIVYGVVSYIRIRKKLLVISPLEKNIYLADDIHTPFVMGVICPKIYIPSNMEKEQLSYIISHERHHIRRGDHIMKMLAFFALSIHWFNPFVWIAFLCAGRDMEMSCDEAVVKKMGDDILADYTASLLSLATGKRIVAGMPLAFGEGDPKGRIRNLANWKKPAMGVVLLAIIVCVVAGIGLMTNPEKKEPDDGKKEGYYLLITDNGVKTVEVTGPYFSGGIQNADGSLYKPGEKVWLEGITDLKGTTVMLYGTNGEIINGFSIPANVKEDEITEAFGKNSYLLLTDKLENTETDKESTSDVRPVEETGISYLWPTGSTNISTTFGERKHPITGEKNSADYIGIAGSEGDSIYAVADGEIMEVGFDNTLGSFIVLATVTGEEVTYGHLGGSKVATGAQVKAGEIIGVMGQSGKATGTFLSLSVKVNNEMTDPMLYLTTVTPEETILYNGKEYNKSELCNDTLHWLELSEQERMLSSYLPPEFMIFEETWGITLIAENITPTGMTLKCTQAGGNATGNLQTGSWYILEKWTKEDGWKEAPCFAEVTWTEEGWMIPGNDTCQWEVDWEWLYGILPAGKYRIGKSIMDFRSTGDYDTAIYFAEFEIME